MARMRRELIPSVTKSQIDNLQAGVNIAVSRMYTDNTYTLTDNQASWLDVPGWVGPMSGGGQTHMFGFATVKRNGSFWSGPFTLTWNTGEAFFGLNGIESTVPTGVKLQAVIGGGGDVVLQFQTTNTGFDATVQLISWMV